MLTAPKPATPIRPLDLTAIPADLTRRPQWVTWQWQWDAGRGRWTKRPLVAGTDRWASSTAAATWRPFPVAAEAWAARRQDGLGFVMTAADPFVGVDLDHCRAPDTGMLAEWAAAIVATLASYTEVTPTGTGLRIWLCGALPDTGRKRGDVEVYDRGRYLTVTGQRVPGTPATITDDPPTLIAWLAATFPPRVAPALTPSGPSLYSDPEILALAERAANGAKFRALFYQGDTSAYHSGSEGHAALCAMLAWYTADAAQLERLINASALAAHRKWATRPDYRARTIGGALGLVTPRRATPVPSRLVPEARR